MLDALFGARAPAALRYADLLRGTGVQRGLIGPQEGRRIWQRHLVNCAVIAPVFSPASRVCDVGSGAGLPGVVLALARPDLSITLLEPLLRRVAFLEEVVRTLTIDNVAVVRGRAEQLSGQSFDAVTARAVAPLDTLARWCLPLLAPGGELVALKGARAADEVEASRQALQALGVTSVTISSYGAGFVAPPATVVRLQSASKVRP